MSPAALLLLVSAAISARVAHYEPRHDVIARAIVAEAAMRGTERLGAAELAAWAVVTMDHESSFSEAVHSGAKRGDGSRAACLLQLHQSRVFAPSLAQLVGVSEESTRRCVSAGMRAFLFHARRCRSALGGFAGYATGRWCGGFGGDRFGEYQRLLNAWSKK